MGLKINKKNQKEGSEVGRKKDVFGEWEVGVESGLIKIYCLHVSPCHRINESIPCEKKEAVYVAFYQPNNV